MQKIINWMNENKIRVGFVGMALVITTQYATCTLEPNTGIPEQEQQEPVEE
jgi:hypothetical protein